MKRAWTAVLGCALGFAAAADAQIIRADPITQPGGYVSAAVGWLQNDNICNPDENACWAFGTAAQYRGSIELPLGPSTSWGITATTASMPVRWGSATGAGCSACDADVTISQYLATLHLGGNRGIQQVIDLAAGATMYENFRTNSGTIGTGKTITNFTFAIAFGFSFGISPRIQAFVQQEYAVVMHKKSQGVPDNSAQQNTLRLGGRFAFGGR